MSSFAQIHLRNLNEGLFGKSKPSAKDTEALGAALRDSLKAIALDADTAVKAAEKGDADAADAAITRLKKAIKIFEGAVKSF